MRVPWNEDMRVKFPATVQFMRLGYEYQSLKDADIHPETRIFLNRFVPAIQRINRDKNLTVEQILATIEEIHGIIKNNDMGKEFLGRLLDQTADIKLIDFDHPEDNDFAVVDELTFGPEAKGSFRPDINILVNGIPLGFLEVKKPNNEGGIQKEFHRMLDERLQVPEFKKYFNMLQFVTFSNNMEYETDNDAAPAEEVRAGSFYSTPNGNRTFFSFFREENPKTSGFKEIYMDEVRYKQGENNDNGSVQINLSVDILKSFSIPLPSMEKQKRIAFFLDSIDKKIDNNNVISAELEGMAKDLYDYWFVQFDFPDENGKPYKSSGGKMVWNDELKREIPEGWENGIVSDLGTVVTGGTPSTGCAEYFAKSKSGHAWATPKDLSNLNGRYFYHGEADITDAGLKNSAGNIMPKGSVLFTTRAPIGYIAITANEACTNQGFKSIIPAKKFGTEFVFQTLKMLTPQMQRVGVGSTFKEVSKDVFSRQSIVIPSVNLLKKYAALTLDIAEKIRNTQEENVELTSLRDFLLPMLMNGQVKVKGA